MCIGQAADSIGSMLACPGVIMLDEAQQVSGVGGQGTVDAGPLVQLHIAPSRTFWRIGPAWAVVGGAVAAGIGLGDAGTLLRLAAAVVLADLAWGILRRIIPDSPGFAGTVPPAAPSLPYGRGDAPLARFLQMIAVGERSAAAPWLGWLGGLAFAVVLSLLLGRPILVLSAAAVGLILLARALMRRGHSPAMCLALLDVALPWVLGAALVWPGVGGEVRPWLWQAGILAAAFTVLQWGVHRARFSAGQRPVGLWLGQMVLLGALIALQLPWAVAIAALLLAPPTWWLARGDLGGAALARSLPWWLASMLSVAAIAR